MVWRVLLVREFGRVRESSVNEVHFGVGGRLCELGLFVVVGAVEISNSQGNLCSLRFGRALCKSEGCCEPYGGRTWLR